MCSRSLTQALAGSNELVDIAIEDIIEVLKNPGIEAEDRLEVMLVLTRRKPAAVFWPVFHATWRACDNTYRVRNRLLKVLSSRDVEARSTDYLPIDAKALFERLPNPFIAFRGCSKARVLGVSWTTNKAIAEQFARGDGTTLRYASLVTASVPKSAVFGVYKSDEEAELVINPRRVRLSVHPLAGIGTRSSPYAEWEKLVEQVRCEGGGDFGGTPAAWTAAATKRLQKPPN
jgi:hypothetical protein